ncbi:hypothetical protein A5N15_11320 [Rothia kristinae]|uniref:Uncharacterized protein n=1 Tax=Rothia kristinae TaxID=37923 RepID=A0A657ITG3_9MICC|nr:hypothetical protein A5N15_11320 [Rothia kristinae]
MSGSRCTRKTGWNRASEPPWFPATSAVTEETRKGMSSVTIIRVQPRPVRTTCTEASCGRRCSARSRCRRARSSSSSRVLSARSSAVECW